MRENKILKNTLIITLVLILLLTIALSVFAISSSKNKENVSDSVVTSCATIYAEGKGSQKSSLTGPNTASAGSLISLTFALDVQDVYGISGKLNYDSEKVELVSKKQVIKNPWIVEFNAKNFIAYDSNVNNPLNGNTTLFTLDFRVKDILPGSQIDISISDIVATDGNHDIAIGDASYAVTTKTIQSDENLLTMLEVTNAVLSPSFDANITQYNTTVNYSVERLEIKAKCSEKATIIYNNPILIPGATTNVSITVKAESGKERVYEIKVFREKDHKWSDWEVVSEPDCGNDGQRKRTCLNCGAVETEVIQSTGHTYGEWIVSREATCTIPGSRHKMCKNCNDVIMEEIPAIGHKYNGRIVLPTCTEQGYTIYTCEHCGDSYNADFVAPLGHNYTDFVVDQPPTCTSNGSQHKYCTICNEIITETIPKIEHTYKVHTIKPTCTEQGYDKHVCTMCNDEYIDNYVPANGHNYDKWVVSKQPTCTSEGERYAKCKVCGEKIVEGIMRLQHEYGDWKVSRQATCAIPGSKFKKCKNCHSVIMQEIPVISHSYTPSYDNNSHFKECSCGHRIDEEPHIFSDWKIVSEPTYEKEGERYKECKCGYKIIEEIPALRHEYVHKYNDTHHYDECIKCGNKINIKEHIYTNWLVEKKPTCIEKGIKTATCECGHIVSKEVDILPHEYGDFVVEIEPTHELAGRKAKTCIKCGNKITESIPALGHNFVIEIVQPTCDEMGYTKHTCSCGASFESDYTKSLGHNYGEWILDSEPTCKENGSRHKQCSRCDSKISETIPKLNHNYVTEVVLPTCTNKGYTIFTCEHCGESYKSNYVNATGHIFGQWTYEKQATCSEPGLKIKTCIQCGEQISETIPALGHNYDREVINPTCIDKGYTIYTCTHCGDSYISNYTPPVGHKYGEFTIDNEASCTTLGSKHRVCEICGKVDVQEIVKKSHSYNTKIISPTCTERGYTKYTCVHCGDEFKDNYTDPLGHKYGDWKVVKDATYESEGIEERVCVCGNKETRAIPKLVKSKKDNTPLYIGLGVGIPLVSAIIVAPTIIIVKRKRR